MEQNQEKQNKKDFLLEHYTQISEHLRESDRNRNILLAVYSAFVTGMLSFMYSTDKLAIPKWVILVFLIVFGLGIAVYTTFARAWHCEYTRVARAIYKSFINADLGLYKAAKEIKTEYEDRHQHYFNIISTEFIIFVLILLFVSAELVLVIYEIMPEYTPWLIYSSIISSLLVFGVGIGCYAHCLDMREREFPEDSWCIIKEKEEKMAESNLERIEASLERIEASLEKIEGKLDKSQKFSWSSSFYLLGVAALGAGIGLLVGNPHALVGRLIFLVGLIISIIGVASLLRHGRFRKERIRN